MSFRFECSSQNSSNSYHFWNNKLVFLHSSSVSWDTTPLYFFSQNLCTFNKRTLSKYKFGEISREQSKVWNFALRWAPFLQIKLSLSWKSTEELSLMNWRMMHSLKKTDLLFPTWHEEFGEFSRSHSNIWKYHFDGLF